MKRFLTLLLFIAWASHAADLKCGTCHPAQAKAQMHSAMAHALAPPGNNPNFRSHPMLSVQKGPFTYTIETRDGTTTYSVTDGHEPISVPVHWTFGADNQTYVLEYKGKWYESLISYFSEIDGLDTTIGDASLHPTTVEQALGRQIDDKEQSACFGCHSSGALSNGVLSLQNITPGLTCDRCHSGALQHQASALKGSRNSLPADLKSETPDQLSHFCGQCHRTWETVMRMQIHGPFDVRFQPYRLANSKCYDGADERLSCVTCHDPHSASLPTKASVDRTCLNCHTSAGHVDPASTGRVPKECPVEKSDCASCHMPKTALPEGHKIFTDHQIRVVRPGDSYPD